MFQQQGWCNAHCTRYCTMITNKACFCIIWVVTPFFTPQTIMPLAPKHTSSSQQFLFHSNLHIPQGFHNEFHLKWFHLLAYASLVTWGPSPFLWSHKRTTKKTFLFELKILSKNSFWIGVKKVISSFWTIELSKHVHCDWSFLLVK